MALFHCAAITNNILEGVTYIEVADSASGSGFPWLTTFMVNLQN
jgi:hypothetical protein